MKGQHLDGTFPSPSPDPRKNYFSIPMHPGLYGCPWSKGRPGYCRTHSSAVRLREARRKQVRQLILYPGDQQSSLTLYLKASGPSWCRGEEGLSPAVLGCLHSPCGDGLLARSLPATQPITTSLIK